MLLPAVVRGVPVHAELLHAGGVERGVPVAGGVHYMGLAGHHDHGGNQTG